MTLTLPEISARPTSGTSRPSILRYDAEVHLKSTLAILNRLRDADASYPPMRLVSDSPFAYADWLTRQTVSARWSAFIDYKLAGHVAIGAPSGELATALEAMGNTSIASNGFMEISKFFVDPESHGRGIGRALFSKVRGYTWATAKQPVLAVPAGSTEALRFFASRGLTDVGTFMSEHDDVHIFIDKTPPGCISSW